MIKYYLIIVFCYFQTFLFGQLTSSDTITSDKVIVIKENNKKKYFYKSDTIDFKKNRIEHAIIAEYYQKCNNFPKCFKEIQNGKLLKAKRFTYYQNCNIREVYNTKKNKIKNGEYTLWSTNGNKIMEGNYFHGKRNGIFKYYNYQTNITKYKDYRYGLRVNKYNSKNLQDTIQIKNIVTADLTCLIIYSIKADYERFIGKKHILKFEIGSKPFYNKEGTNYLTNLSITNPFIFFSPKMFLFSIDNEKLFGINRRLSFVSCGVYYLSKSYKNLIYHESLPEPYLLRKYKQSEDTRIYGLKFLFGKKYIYGKGKIKEVLSFNFGIGISHRNTTRIIYGVGSDSNHNNQNVYLYPEPEIKKINKYEPTFHFGLKYGIGW
ncbi:MAG: hypothetical protein A2X08_04880 [Bacteroidetes bacterium GWA2_32_17]|nr:MAG: hypothetical protein A2X08_04880 [Bacteroidetes bacterium GWA2_32_17]